MKRKALSDFTQKREKTLRPALHFGKVKVRERVKPHFIERQVADTGS